MKGLRRTVKFLAVVMFSSIFSSCSQEGEVEPNSSKGLNYVVVEQSGKTVLYPVSSSSDVTDSQRENAVSWNEVLRSAEITPNNIAFSQNGLDFENTELGQTYSLTNSSSSSRTKNQEIVISGIKYPGGTYDINSQVTLSPIYNDDETNDVPNGVFSVYSESGEFVQELQDGKLDLEYLYNNKVSGRLEIRYSLLDNSQGFEASIFINVFLEKYEESSSRAMGEQGDNSSEHDDEDVHIKGP
ncbi:hypothetical protein [Aureibacter tunicatorum]|uniref:Lipoprotein n=1 Tax=Aureibacter tunicatorum TaxID=866807 RepID=A0AAE4BRT7_9BACT|nr:hypothetical protein [Aureibacter tunicatorum]MDR6240534.1 hypothetical protein [Aureibacter tunicatorum]BDD06605.1 hypothetical protein AUTU_40880 [Aureibacter tunicatorum]